MKKSVVILIAVIYVAAIALVSFFGLQAELLEETVYVTGIELVNSDIQTTGSTKYVVVYLDGNGHAEYQLDWRVTPTNATNTGVNFNYDTTKSFVTIDEKGLVKFTRAGAIDVSLTPKDKSKLENPVKLKIIAK